MESLAADLRTMVRTPLTDDHVVALRRAGEVREVPSGQELVSLGAPADTFIYVIDGEVEAVNPVNGARYGNASLGPGQFFGEISFLNGGRVMMGARTCEDSTLLFVDRAKMLELMAQIPEMSDIVVTVLAARRRRLLESNESALKLIGADEDRAIRRIAAFASRNRIPYTRLERDTPEGMEAAQACGLDLNRPAVIYGDNTPIADPTPRKIAQLLGLDLSLTADHLLDVLIVGGGPAGVAAGVYAGSEGLDALVLEDMTIGGQAGTSSRIENYMGFPTGISGADLVWRGEVQAMKFGTRFAVPRRAADLTVEEDGTFHVGLEDGDRVRTRAVVIATGVQYRRLPLAGLESLEGAGVYYAATEVEARWCRNTEVAVIGGGNSAGQAAMFLSRSAKHVHVLVRGNSLAASMSSYLRARLEKDPRITIHYRTEVSSLEGEGALTGLTIHDKSAGQEWRLNTHALFVMVGAAPNTGWLSGHAALDPKGFVLTGAAVGTTSAYATSHPGIFAVGDVRAGSVKRVASAVGEGSVVISRVWDYLSG